MPVLDDEDRKTVGTLYVAGKIDDASATVSKPFPQDYRKCSASSRSIQSLRPSRHLLQQGRIPVQFDFFLTQIFGMNVHRMEGGYKNYRSTINNMIPVLFERSSL